MKGWARKREENHSRLPLAAEMDPSDLTAAVEEAPEGRTGGWTPPLLPLPEAAAAAAVAPLLLVGGQ